MDVLSIKKLFLILCITREPNPLTIKLVRFKFNSENMNLTINITQCILNTLGQIRSNPRTPHCQLCDSHIKKTLCDSQFFFMIANSYLNLN
jgi:hypothetical protein